MKLFKLFIVLIALTVFYDTFACGDVAAADPLSQKMDDRQAAVDSEMPSLSSTAAAKHAENLAITAAKKADEKVTDAQQAVDEADAALTEAKNSGDKTAINEAQERYDLADRALNDAVASSTGVSAEEISDMRTSGMGWGQIAHEIGVHPGVLGLGHAEVIETNELKMATARNPKTGLSVGHGLSHSGRGIGLDRAEAKKGVGRGIDGKGAKEDGHNIGSLASGHGNGRGGGNDGGHGNGGGHSM